MRRINKTTYFLLFCVLLLAGISVLAWFIYGKIGEISDVLKKAEAQIAFLEAKEKEFSKASSEIENSRAQTDKIRAVFLSEETFVNFMELLESLAREAGVGIRAESAKLPQDTGPANIIFSLEGAFSQIMRFLALLDHIPVAGIASSIEIGAKESLAREKIPSDTLLAKINYIILNYRQK